MMYESAAFAHVTIWPNNHFDFHTNGVHSETCFPL